MGHFNLQPPHRQLPLDAQRSPQSQFLQFKYIISLFWPLVNSTPTLQIYLPRNLEIIPKIPFPLVPRAETWPTSVASTRLNHRKLLLFDHLCT